MATTYIPIQSVTLTSSAASVTFSSIPQTYTDLVVRYSLRTVSGTLQSPAFTVNSLTGKYSYTNVFTSGTNKYSGQVAASFNYPWWLLANGGDTSANTFSSGEIVIPNYAQASYKPAQAFDVLEDDYIYARITIAADLLSDTAAISSITITNAPSTNLAAGCAIHLYGIKNS